VSEVNLPYRIGIQIHLRTLTSGTRGMQDWTKQLTINFSPFLVEQGPSGKQSSLETSATVGTAVQAFDHSFYDPKEFTNLDFLIRASFYRTQF